MHITFLIGDKGPHCHKQGLDFLGLQIGWAIVKIVEVISKIINTLNVTPSPITPKAKAPPFGMPLA